MGIINCLPEELEEANQKAQNDYEYWVKKIDVRRIDICIGEKEHRVPHCLCDDYSIRSRQVWEGNGFSLALTEAPPAWQGYQYHWRLTEKEYGAACQGYP